MRKGSTHQVEGVAVTVERISGGVLGREGESVKGWAAFGPGGACLGLGWGISRKSLLETLAEKIRCYGQAWARIGDDTACPISGCDGVGEPREAR